MFTRYDKALILFLLFFAVLSFVGMAFINKAASKTSEVLITSDGKEVIRLPLQGTKKRMRVKSCVIEITGGRARVVSSDCPNKICVATGWISKPSQIIVCIPQGVTIRIEGDKTKTKVDTVSK
jgi:hypothetical protein